MNTFLHQYRPLLAIVTLAMLSGNSFAHSDHSHFQGNIFAQLSHFFSSPDHLALGLTVSVGVLALIAVKKFKPATRRIK